MTSPYNKKLALIMFTLGIAVFLLMGFLGLSHFSMAMDADGEMAMSDCPFMIGIVICTMSTFEHIATWQSMFAHILQPQHATLLLLSLSLLVLGLVGQRHQPLANRFKQFASFSYGEYVPNDKPFQDLFSNGILNPKSF